MARFTPPGWEPKVSRQEAVDLAYNYSMNPDAYDGKEEDINDIELHASYYQVPFALSEKHQDGIIAGTMKQLGRGFADGATVVTGLLDDTDKPRNTTEAIARNLGELAGFLGNFPGMKHIPGLRLLRGASAPLWIANKATKAVGKKIKPILSNISDDANKLISSSVYSDIASGGFTMGVASAVSTMDETEGGWQDYTKRLLSSMGWGFLWGGGARAISGFNTFGKKINASQVDMQTGNPKFSKLGRGQKADLALRTLANSAFDGLPATLQGQTTADQVYSYLIGAALGWNDLPLSTRTSVQHFQKAVRDKTGESPDMHPDWDNYTDEMQKIIKKDWKFFFGDDESLHAIKYKALQGRKIDIDDIQEYAENKGIKLGFDPVSGEVFDTKLGRDDLKSLRDEYIEKGSFEDMDDLDMHMAKIEDFAGKGQPLLNFIDGAIPYKGEVDKIQKGLEIFEEWGKLLEDGKPKDTAEKDIVSFINKKYNITLKEEDSGWWRSFAEQLRKKTLVPQISLVGGLKTTSQVGFLQGNTNLAGNKKDVSFQPPLIESIYRKLAEDAGIEPSQFYTFLDHVIYDGKEYKLNEAVDRLAPIIKRTSKERLNLEGARAEAEALVKKDMAKTIEFMSSEGFYYYGGKGDAERMYFIKKHPLIKKHGVNYVHNTLRDLLIKKGHYKNKADYDKNFKINSDEYVKDYNAGKNKTEMLQKNHLESVVSNVLYDISFNGFNIDNSSNATFKTSVKEGLERILSNPDSFLHDAKSFNKRSQIWFNTGLTADTDFIKKELNIDRDYFKYLIWDDTDNNPNGKASEQAESTDGAILGREAVVDALNKDKGLPTDGGMNKSFIVSNSDGLGTILGKYAIHIPSKPLREFMRDEDIDLLVPKSAIKQLGEREMWKDDDEHMVIYQLPIKDIKTIMSEKTSKKFIKPQKLPKQMFSTLSAYGYNDVNSKIISQMFDDYMGRAQVGTEKGREVLEAYNKNPTEDNERNIVDNFEELPLKDLLDIIRHPEKERLAVLLSKKILNVNDETYRTLAEEGEMSRSDFNSERTISAEFDSIVDRLLNLYPEGSTGGFLHKFLRDYRMTAFRNFAINKLTRPTLDNSASSRMRPYDFAMYGEIEDTRLIQLNQKRGDLHLDNKYTTFDIKKLSGEDIFFLDNGFRNLMIKSSVLPGGKMTLGQLWKSLSDKKFAKENREEVEELLRATLVRVPMDSMSGANVLRFAGFTDIKGFGSLTHPRTMRALGGADLDGDKAFVFFGGETGMKKEYKDMYDAQRNEFMKENNEEMHNKNEPDPLINTKTRNLFAKTDGLIAEYGENALSYYDPHWRKMMSYGASSGRGVLGYAVTRRAAIIGAYNSIRESMGKDKADKTFLIELPDGREAQGSIKNGVLKMPFLTYYERDVTEGELRYLEMKVSTDEERLKAFRTRARAAIAIGSDPMDEAGVKDTGTFGKLMIDALFDYQITKPKFVKKTKKQRIAKGKVRIDKERTEKVNDGTDTFTLNHGLHSIFSQVNSVLYSKNSYAGTRYSYADVQSTLHKMNILSDDSKTTFLPKLADAVSKLDWSDNIFNRVNHGKIKSLYNNVNSNLNKYKDWLPDLLNRQSMVVPESSLVNFVFQNALHTTIGRNRYVDSEKKFNELFSEFGFPKNEWGREKIPDGLKPINEDSKLWRSAYIDYLVLKAEDFLINDISDMTTAKRIIDIIENNNFADSTIDDIFQKANQIKNNSFHMARQRQESDGDMRWDIYDGLDNDAVLNDGPDPIGKASVAVDNFTLDKRIRDYKSTLTRDVEKELFDTFLLGSFQRGNIEALQSKEKAYRDTKNPFEKKLLRKEIEMLEKQANNSSTVRVGLTSKEVSDVNVKKFFDEYDSYYTKTLDKFTEKEINDITDQLGGKDKVTELIDGDGKRIEGSIIEEADLSARARKYLDEIEPFIGIKDGKILDADLREAYYDITRHLDNMHNADAKQINLLFRSVVGKNINTANKQDILVFKRYLDDLNTPNFWRRMFDYVTGKKPYDIKRMYYFKFPASIDRELMTTPGFRQLIETVNPYKDRFGNTITGKALTPMSPMAEIQQFSARSTEIAMQVAEKEKSKLRDDFEPFVAGIDDGDILYKIAVTKRELPIGEKALASQEKDPLNLFNGLMYKEQWDEVKDSYNKLKDKIYKVPFKGKVRLMTGDEVITNINSLITKYNEYAFSMLSGKDNVVDKWLDLTKDANGKLTYQGLDLLRKKWNLYLSKLMKENKPLPIQDFGIDGIRLISKHIIQSFTPRALRKGEEGALNLERIAKGIDIVRSDKTGQYSFDVYYPHVGVDRSEAQKQLNNALKKINEDGNMSKAEKEKQIISISLKYKSLTGDYLAKDDMGDNFDIMNDVLTAVADGKLTTANNILSSDFKKVGNQFSRKAHIKGYSKDPQAYESYLKNIIDTFYKQAMQTANRSIIYEAGERIFKQTKDANLTNAWRNFFKLYAQQAMGYPVVIPDKVLDDPLMKIKGTPYKWFSDSQVKKRVDFIGKALGINRKILKEYELDENVEDELAGIQYSTLNAWSAQEARFQLMSLLAHPKSAIANVYGGSVHTIANTGMTHFKNARNIEYLKSNINPEWRTLEDVDKWLQKLGVTEEFLLYEAGLNPNAQSSGFKNMVKEVATDLRNNKKVELKRLLELKKKFKLSPSVFKFASSFMRVPERMLRRDSFMAHYLQARENFGNSIRDFDHPFLIEMAKKGVKATQFLYSAPYRPMWTNSALGRIMSRFQLWSYNSVRFRTETARQAKIYGYSPGTQEYDSAVRLLQADAMMLALSSVFTYSLFETSLPAPYNWLQDFAEWMFGNDKERERAFFGSPLGPVQIVTPPSLRLLPPLWKWMMNKPNDRLFDYYAWTMMPFGRLIKDVVGPGGIVHNPAYTINKMTGMPVHQITKIVKDAWEDESA